MHQYAVQNSDRVKHKEPIKGWTSEKMPRIDSTERRSKPSTDCFQNQFKWQCFYCQETISLKGNYLPVETGRDKAFLMLSPLPFSGE